jgi:hypothetical protein
MTSEFIALMTHDVIVRKRDRNITGDWQTLSEDSEKGFVEYGNHLVTNAKDENIKCTAIVYLKSTSVIDINHLYWEIDQTSPYSRSSMEVMKINPIDDPRTGRTHHYEVHAK